MELTNHINPTPEQIEELKKLPLDEPIIMVNILKLHPENGDVYLRYLENVFPFVEAVGGRLLWKGKCLQTAIGGGEAPDMFLLVEYPSLKKFFEMIFNPEYQKVGKGRTRGLAFGGLYVTQTDFSIW